MEEAESVRDEVDEGAGCESVMEIPLVEETSCGETEEEEQARLQRADPAHVGGVSVRETLALQSKLM